MWGRCLIPFSFDRLLFRPTPSPHPFPSSRETSLLFLLLFFFFFFFFRDCPFIRIRVSSILFPRSPFQPTPSPLVTPSMKKNCAIFRVLFAIETTGFVINCNYRREIETGVPPREYASVFFVRCTGKYHQREREREGGRERGHWN